MLSPHVLECLLLVFLKFGAIFVVVYLIAKICRGYSAAFRRALWISAFVGYLVTAGSSLLFRPAQFSIQVHTQPGIKAENIIPGSDTPHVFPVTLNEKKIGKVYALFNDLWGRLSAHQKEVGAVWIISSALILIFFTWRFWKVRRLMKDSEEAGQSIQCILDTGALKMGIQPPRKVLVHSGLDTALTFGCFKPVVVFPKAAMSWSADSFRIVVLHELAHIKRRDAFFVFLSKIVCSIFWFHPVVWISARCLGAEREKACDEIVLNEGIKPSAYASQLLQLAAGMKDLTACHRMSFLSGKSSLKSRLHSILEPLKKSPDRSVRNALFICSGVLLLGLSLFSLNIGQYGLGVIPKAGEYWQSVEDKEDSLAFVFEKTLSERGIRAACDEYLHVDSISGYHDRDEFNALGYRLIESGHVEEALIVFLINAREFPDSWQVYNGLGNAYDAKGDKGSAVANFERMLNLDPPNIEKIQRAIENLKKGLQ